MRKWLKTDFNDTYIEEEQEYNQCGEKLYSRFYLRIARYGLFGQKYYFRWYEWYCAMGDCMTGARSFKNIEELQEEWQKFITNTKIIKHENKLC